MSRVQLVYLLLLACTVYQDVSGMTKARLVRRGKHGRLGTLATPDGTPLPPDQWYTQLLDHFDPTNNSTWQQKYQVVTDHYVQGGPVFIMLGGEGTASAVWMVKGNWVNYAKQYNALMFQLEHRFYGDSHPTSDLSVPNLRYLTSEQALADAAYFVQAMSEQYHLPAGTRWIAFGGSYPGNLAAWFRYKYPHLIHGAMSASGPVLAKTDFPEYLDVVRNSLATYGDDCVYAVESANRLINWNLKHPKGRKIINEKFRLCEPIDDSNKNNVYNLLQEFVYNIAEIVQYNKDDRSFNITIDTICDIMVDKSRGNPLIRYAAVNSMLMDVYAEICLNYNYQEYIEELQDITWEGVGASYGARQWVYQTCTEFGYYQTSESKAELFGNDIPLDFSIQHCTDIFGDSFTKEVVDAGVNRTNLLYGGLDLPATKVVYVHGSIDPWHALGITSTSITDATAIFINGTAHCANMYPPADTDLPALQAARKKVGDLIGEWINQK